MAVSEQTPRNNYTASGSTDTFAFTFGLIAEADLQVKLDSVLQTLNVDYTIQGLSASGGDVVFTSNPAADVFVELFRQTPRDQDLVYPPYDPFPAKSHEGALDKITYILQERDEDTPSLLGDNRFEGKNTFVAGDIVLDNNSRLRGVDSLGVEQSMVFISQTSDRMFFGGLVTTSVVRGLNVEFQHETSTIVFETATRDNGSLLVRDRNGISKKAGFRNPTHSTEAASRSVDQDDEGRILDCEATLTLTIEQLEANTEMEVTTGSGDVVTLAEGAGVEIQWHDGSGTIKTGNRSLAGASAVKLSWKSVTIVQVSGIGIS